MGGTEVVEEEVKVVEVASLANRNDLYQFIHAYPCFSAPLRPNTIIKFRLADASKPLLTNLPSPMKPKAWADLLARHPESLRIHLPMVQRFGAELGYEGPNAFILSENLASALEDYTIIEKELQEDLASGRVTPVHQLSRPFICSLLGLVPKHNGGWRRIHHLSHPHVESVNSYIPDGVGEIRYKCFQEVLQLVINEGRYCVIMKRDVKDAFRNVPVALQHRWLQGFRWERRYYKETCLSFGLATAPFIFNLFAEALHWIIASFLRWVLCHFLDDFMTIFGSDTSTERLMAEANAYIWLTDLLGLLRNDFKDYQGTMVTVFRIKVDTSSFTARLPKDKLEKAILASSKVLSQKAVSYIDIQSLVRFFSFCSQAVRLGRVFMKRLRDFINYYSRNATRSTLRRIPVWVREDLEWWNKLLTTYNGVLFFDTRNKVTQTLYTDACLYGLGGFYFEGRQAWEQVKVNQSDVFCDIVKRKSLPANRKTKKNSDDPSINVHEVEAILLAFQTWAEKWSGQRLRVFTDSTTAYSGLYNG